MTNAKVVNLIYKNGKVLGVEIEQKGRRETGSTLQRMLFLQQEVSIITKA